MTKKGHSKIFMDKHNSLLNY